MTMQVNGTTGWTFPDASTQATAATGFGFKNRIINGAMVIDQRNAGASVTVTTTTGYTLDRWTTAVDASSKFSVQQVADAPSGFTYSLKVTSLSAYTPSSSEEFRVGHIVEGYNTADLDFGLSTAKTFTLSFWVKSSLTGTFGLWLANATNARTLVSTYTINAANTWEQKTVTLTADTTGTWDKTNGRGLQVFFQLAAGSNYYTATTNTWTSSSGVRTTSAQTQLVATNGATLNITGVQLEKGSTATSFDYRPYGTELALCQRYFELARPITCSGRTSTDANMGVVFSVPKRTNVTVTAPYATSYSVVTSGGVLTTSGALTIAADVGGQSITTLKLIVTAASWGLSAGVFYDPTFSGTPVCGASAEL